MYRPIVANWDDACFTVCADESKRREFPSHLESPRDLVSISEENVNQVVDVNAGLLQMDFLKCMYA